jgi:hypothetical protein
MTCAWQHPATFATVGMFSACASSRGIRRPAPLTRRRRWFRNALASQAAAGTPTRLNT